MAWRIVRQPNGLLARFSDVVDIFTHYDLTEQEALEVCVEFGGCTRPEAREKVRRGLEDYAPMREDGSVSDEPSGDPEKLARWRDCLATIRAIKGAADADWFADWCSRPQAEVRA